MQESAFRDPPWLLEREGAGYIQVTDLLYRIAEHCGGTHTVDEIAAAISDAGRPVSPATVRALIAQLLIQRGLVEMADRSVVPVATGGLSPLALNMRMKMIGPDTIMPVTSVLRGLYWPPVFVAVLLAATLAEGWLYVVHGVGAGLHDALYAPGLMAIVLLVVVVSAAFHELGHAAALHYAGGRIKGMGAGLYIVYPAFFTDVSDNYRLTRWKRVRTDLGGFYFNLIFALAIMGLFLLSGREFLLLMVLMINLEIIHQLLPFLRLDGYWALADVTGVPDFFSLMSAFVRSMLPIKASQGRKLPPLKPWGKVVFGLYTLITIPLLLLVLVLMIRGVPRVLATAWDSIGQQGQAFVAAKGGGDLLGMLAATGQAVLLLIPTIGLAYTLFSLGRRFTVALWKWGKPTVVRRAVSTVCLLGAAAVLAFMWLPQLPLLGGAPQSAPVGFGPIRAVSWQPIAADERGTLQDAVSDVVASPPLASSGARPAPARDVQPGGTPAAPLNANATPAAETSGSQLAPTPPARANATPAGALTPSTRP